MITAVDPQPDDLNAVVDEVWSTFIGAEEPLLPHPGPDWSEITGWSAAATISGGWQGMVVISLPDRLAFDVTNRMLGLDPAQKPITADVTDAVGELVNIIGGNVKSLVPGPSTLSLPVVVHGTVSHSSDLVGVCCLDFEWAGQPIQVSVLVSTLTRNKLEGS